MFFSPLTFLFMIFFFLALVFFFFIVQIDIIALVFARIGISSHFVFTALFFSLVGSLINIPIKKIPQENMVDERIFPLWGVRHGVPLWKKKETVLAVNLGGAVIPAVISAYLLFKTGLWLKTGIVTIFIILLTYRLAKPVRGLGIALPPFLPPLAAALASVIIGGQYAPVLAYVSGSMGSLIGADLLNLNKIAKLGAPVASIGGAGTFDGIFLNGIIAVLLAAILV